MGIIGPHKHHIDYPGRGGQKHDLRQGQGSQGFGNSEFSALKNYFQYLPRPCRHHQRAGNDQPDARKKSLAQGCVKLFPLIVGQQLHKKRIGSDGNGLAHQANGHLGNAAPVIEKADPAFPQQTAENAQKLLVQHYNGLAKHERQGDKKKFPEKPVFPDQREAQAVFHRHGHGQ